MTRWPDLQKHMRSRYRLQDDQPDLMSMVWAYEDGRSQKIVVRRYQVSDRDMVEFKSAFARVGDVEPEALLRANAEMPLALTALVGETYLVVYNALMDSLSLDDFDVLLSRVAAGADALEQQYGRRDEF